MVLILLASDDDDVTIKPPLASPCPSIFRRGISHLNNNFDITMGFFSDIEHDVEHAASSINWEQAGEAAVRGASSGFKQGGIEGKRSTKFPIS